MSQQVIETEVVVLGSGPGGYTAAFRAADLGKKVVLVERYASLGGVCLNVGCIPSKALLKVAESFEQMNSFKKQGLFQFSEIQMDLSKIREWKDKVVGKLTNGLKMLAKQRQVTVVTGVGSFISPHELKVVGDSGEQIIRFQNAIIAAGSQPVRLPFLPEDPRIIDSTGALALTQVEGDMLVLGGGIIGLEMATVYHALGARITVVELMDQLIPGADKDIVMPLHKRVSQQYEKILLKTKVTKVEAKKDGLYVTFEGESAPDKPQRFDRILAAVGRKPNGALIGAEKAGVHVDERGFIPVNAQMQTNVSHIYAIGDIVGQPMLAHKAIPEGRVAAERIAGLKHDFAPRCIPAVAYTDPEIAWVGLTETEAKAKNIPYEKGVFPWIASGRALSMGRDEGLTKVLFDPKTHRIIGAGIVGAHAGDLISEAVLAIEMGCDATDIALSIHPHPTLSETIAMATEVFEGTITDLFLPKKKVVEK